MRFIHTILFLSVILGFQAQDYPIQKFSNHEDFGKWIDNHPFSIRPPMAKKEVKAMPKADRPDLAVEQDFLRTLDPSLGYPPKERLIPVLKKVKAFKENNNQRSAPGSANLPWVERGPTNVAGRTRAIAFDPNDLGGNKVFAGGVAGGLWYNNDITNTNSPWNKIDDFWDNIAVSTICFDPTNSQIAYVGTGEGWFNIDAVRGYGIWKTTDGGTTWNHLAATNGSAFNYVQKVVVHPLNGDVYAATRNGLRRSQDGGASWSEVLGSGNGSSSDRFADIEISANNTIYASAGLGNTDGIYKSTTGNVSSWSKLNTGTNGFPITDIKRIELAVAPSNANVIYAVAQSGNSSIKGLYRSDDQGSNWVTLDLPEDEDGGIPTSDFSRGQAWYDLTAAVDPNNSANVVVGAIDLFKSTNSGTSWTQISHWFGGYGFPYVHADQHALVFKPGSSNVLINGNDGGVYYTSNITSLTPAWEHPTLNYNVTQFYSCAINPNAGSSNFLAGSQDNGTQKFTQPGFASTTTATGGDGAFCFIDQTNSNIQITSYVYNTFYVSTNGGSSFSTLMNDGNSGSFINPADYDDNLNILYTYKDANTLKRITDVGSANSISDLPLSFGGSVRHIRVSPYTTLSTTLFVGTSSGKIFKVTNADGGSPNLVDIDSDSELPIGSISCIEIGSSEAELLVTFSNYGVNSVWYSNNGGSTWTSREGDLPDMPVRWALFSPIVTNEVILATEVGVWSTANISVSSPTWIPSNSGLANTRVDMLQSRDSDYEIIAATHGRGLFSSTSALLDLDVSMQQFLSPGNELCDSIFTPQVVFENSGELTLNSVQFDLFIDDIFVESTNWIGNLISGVQTSITFSEFISSEGNHTIRVESSLPNGGIDENSFNDDIELGIMIFPIEVAPHLNNLNDNIVPPNDWQLNNPDDGITWEIWNLNTSFECLPGGSAIIRHFHYGGSGQKDEMISPRIDKGLYNNLKFVFDRAHGQINANDNSKLEIFASGDCGNNWNLKWSKSGDELATAPDSIWFYVPSCEEWTRDTIDLSEFDDTGVMIKIVATNGGIGNIYLDNMNISGEISGCTDPAAINFNPLATSEDGSCQYCDLSIEIGITMDSCIGTNDISLAAIPTSIYSTSFTYSWFFDLDELSSDSVLSSVNVGYYELQVTDNNNCTAYADVLLNEFGITNIELLSQSACTQSDNTYSQDLRITYQTYLTFPEILDFNIIVNGQSFPIIGSPQIVTLDNLDSDGLPVDVSAHITDNVVCNYIIPSAFVAPLYCFYDCEANLAFNLSKTDDCPTDIGGDINLSLSTYTEPVNHTWSGPNGFTSSSQNLFGVEPGWYVVIVTDANCTQIDSIEVEAIGITGITTIAQSACNNQDNTYDQILEFSYNEFAGFENYQLSVNGNLIDATGSPQIILIELLSDGQEVDISAFLTNEVGCSITELSLFTAPESCVVDCNTALQFTLTKNDYCINSGGGDVGLNLISFEDPVSFDWTGPNGFTSSLQNLGSVQPGWYTVTVSDANCIRVDSIEVSNIGIISISEISQSSCDAQSNSYSETLEIVYEEFTGFENFEINVNGNLYDATGSPQQITLVGLPANGQQVDVTAFLTNNVTCSATEINLFTAPEDCTLDCELSLLFTLSKTDNCLNNDGGTINLDLLSVTNPVNFDWIGPNGFISSSQNLVDLEQGWYVATVTDANCVKYDSILVEDIGINSISSISQSNCDSQSNTYDQTLEVSYIEFTGIENFQLNVNGNLYNTTGSPQQITLIGLNADGESVDVTAFLTNDMSCSLTEVGLFIAPEDCSIDCESSLQFNLSKTDYCVNGTSGTINLNLVSFTNPINFDWVGPNGFTATSLNLTELEQGWYTVAVTDANCTKQDSILIEAIGISSINTISQSACNNENNTYNQVLEIVYEEFSGFENYQLDVNGVLFPPNGSPQTVSLNGLVADGQSIDVTTYLTNDATCFSFEENLFAAPMNCSVNCDTALQFSLSSTDYCVNDAGGTIDLTLIEFTNPGSISWTGPNGFTSNLLSLTDLEKGMYVVTVTDVNCIKEDSIEVEAIGIIDIIPISQTPCENVTNTYDQVLEISYEEFPGYENYDLNLNGYIYTPTGSPQVINLTGLLADGLDVDISGFISIDPSCSFVQPALFTAPINCDCASQVSLGADTSLCDGNSLLINTSGGNFINYLWSDATTGSTLLVDSSGSYYVEVMDDFGCSSSDTILVTFQALPIVNAGLDQNVCPGENVFLDGSIAPLSVSNWQVLSGSSTIFDVTQLNSEVSNLSLGENIFQLEVNDGICGLISDLVSIDVEDIIAPIVNCPTDLTIVVNSLPYVMEDFTSAITFIDNCAGTLAPSQSPIVGTDLIADQVVTFTVTDENNNSGQCSLNLILDYQTICTNESYPAPVNLQTVVVPIGYDLNWDPVPGSIVCQVKGGTQGGGDFASLIVWGVEVSSKSIDVAELTPGTSYQWKVRCACATQPSIIAGPFSAYDFFTVPSESAPYNRQMEREYIEILSLFPNPAFNEIEILFELDHANAVNVEVIDILGTIVFSQNTTGLKGQNNISVALEDLPSGNYYLKISNAKNISGSHFVITR